MTFPDYDALVVESKPDIAGGDVRLAMLRRGAELERDRIIGLIEDAKRGLKFGDDRLLVDNIIALIKGEKP